MRIRKYIILVTCCILEFYMYVLSSPKALGLWWVIGFATCHGWCKKIFGDSLVHNLLLLHFCVIDNQRFVNKIIMISFSCFYERLKGNHQDFGLCFYLKQHRWFFWPFLHISNHEYYGDNFISKPNPNPRYKVSIICHQY